jgi:hypothetical protein
MSEFKKETRYVVLKLSKMTDHQKSALGAALSEINIDDSVMPECVVVESDWPNYQETWDSIKSIVEGDFASRRDRIAELEREKVVLVAQIEVLKQLAEPAIKLMRATGASSGWHKKADELDLVVNSKLTTQCLNQIKAEAVRKFSSELASRVEVPDSSAQKIEYYKAAILHVLQFAEQYAESIAKGE